MAPEFPLTATDPDGVVVRLTKRRWNHVVAGHPELAPFLDAVLTSIRTPTRRMPGRKDDEQWFYVEGVGPSRCLKVVVRYEETGGGRIVTAFARRSMP